MSSFQPSWTIESFCASQSPSDWTPLPESSRSFLQNLGLPSSHPLCDDNTLFKGSDDVNNQAPSSLMEYLLELHDYDWLEAMVTFLYMTIPPYISFVELWIRLISGFVAPLSIAALFSNEYILAQGRKAILSKTNLSILSICAVYGSLIIMTDSMYVYEYGMCGLAMFTISVPLAHCACKQSRLMNGLVAVLLAFFITFDKSTNTFQFGEPTDVNIDVDPGLYYSAENTLLRSAVEKYWPISKRTYNKETGATPFMFTGDARTGLPFFFNRVPAVKWTRVYLLVEDGEILGLDIAFPEAGHDFSKPIYLILHGANGGSDEAYVRDLALRQTVEGSTVVVMIARGLMDLPILNGNIFHVARVADVHITAMTIREKAMVRDSDQILVAMGYSIGGIVLNNYVASYGSDCALDAAFSISGGLEARFEKDFQRPKHLWQPMIADFSRKRHLNKWGQPLKSKLSRKGMISMLRATDMVLLDNAVTVDYYGKNHFKDLTDYYSQMGAMGDIAMENFDRSPIVTNDTVLSAFVPNFAKINHVSIPLCNLFAFDDPVVTWRSVAANEGILHPNNIVLTGTNNLLILLTATGGHVGWPTGWLSYRNNWKWMNEAGSSFFDAIITARRELEENHESGVETVLTGTDEGKNYTGIQKKNLNSSLLNSADFADTSLLSNSHENDYRCNT